MLVMLLFLIPEPMTKLCLDGRIRLKARGKMHCSGIGFGARRVGLIVVIYIYAIMKNTRHKYHYTVRRLKKEKINIKNRGLQKHHVIVNYLGIILTR